ncbi:DUF2141 domain-containing protein [Qipengyuania sp. 902]|uniref:DUF2141 domain-containing protein n=1 Tax=Qipengyuania sp. 902 TaxID=3417565 RepID=UPI003EB85393
MMRAHKTRAVALLALPFGLALAGTSPHIDQAKVTVTVTDLRNAEGVVRACMTKDETKFPKCRGVPGAYATTADAREGTVTFTFSDVKPGRYAIALLHDENGNGKADRALGMMPKEGFGFSRDAKVRMGPPSFEDAVFPVGAANERLTIRMRYML